MSSRYTYTEHIDHIAVETATPATLLADKEEESLNIPGGGIITLEHVVAVGNYAARNPARWATIALHLTCPGLTRTELATELNISIRTVRRHLAAINISNQD